MEPDIKRLAETDMREPNGIANKAQFDARSLIAAAIGGAGYWLLAMPGLDLSRDEAIGAAVWLPNACAVAILLRARIQNELAFLAAIFLASVLAYVLNRAEPLQSLIFSGASLLSVVLTVWITRRAIGKRPDMTELSHVIWFAFAGGLIGPLLSTSLASIALLPSQEGGWEIALGRFLAESMAMVLIVPAALLIVDAVQSRAMPPVRILGERALLLVLSLLIVFLIFEQSTLPLLFLIPPITFLHAFRLGSLGTAIFVGLAAVIAVVMTQLGKGPLALMVQTGPVRMHVVQIFIAANFLTGLPVAAILAGRTRIMAEVESGKRQLDMLAANISDAVLRYDMSGRCTYASTSVRDVLGVDPSEFIGARVSDRMHDDARNRILLTEERLIGGLSEHERFTYRRFLDAPDGTPVFIEADCVIARNTATGANEGIVVSARDVTERVDLELRLTRARRRAENAAQAKSEFLANMSHEIRTPMNGVLGFAEMILQSELNEEQRRHAQLIVESGRSMMLLLNDILDLSKIESGQISIDPEPVDLRSTVFDCAALQRPAAERKGLDLRIEIDGIFSPPPDRSDANARERAPSSNHPWVLTDGLRLRQILLNLIGNAVKFTEEGHVNVLCTLDQGGLSIKVIDTGIGISEARIKSIFSPFTQAENDTTRRYGGTGLGLAISSRLARLLGGTIEVESEPGAGSSFTLSLPVKLVEPAQLPDPGSAAENEPVAGEQKATQMIATSRILLVEDHDINRLLATEMLARCGQEVETAHDGNEAISMVMDSIMRAKPYDLVLMDIQMPGCDGYAATEAIRGEGIGPQMLPIIALTANAFPEDIAASRKAGMQAHLAKPIVFAQLARALQRWLPTRIIEAEDHAADAKEKPADPVHSPEAERLWQSRRIEAIEAVTEALEREGLREGALEKERRDALVQLMHKLAGTAAMFDQTELGELASVFERALKMNADGELLETLAHNLLALANGQDEANLASAQA